MIKDNLDNIRKELPSGVKLVAVSKFHPLEDIKEAMEAGQLVFGENRPQELKEKVEALGEGGREVEWHFLGHLQTNKLKMVLPYASVVESVDSIHLLKEIDAWGKANGKVINVLLELHVAAEETKQGFAEEEALDILFDAGKYRNVNICGLMTMASHTDDADAVDADFARVEDFFLYCRDLFPELDSFRELSMGMSGDWRIAVSHGATTVRIGTSIFGERL